MEEPPTVRLGVFAGLLIQQTFNKITEGSDYMKHFIEFQDATKAYGSHDNIQLALDKVSFTIDEGTFVVILGQSGAGKTTLLNLLGGMDTLTSGNIIVNGTGLYGMNDNTLTEYRAEHIGFIFQFYNLITNLTARENVALIKEVTKDALDADDMLDAVGLAAHKNKFPPQLSGGEQQRVSIARALSKNPSLLLGDEPTGALDAATGIAILELLQDMCEKRKKTVILVTHNAAISECADKVICLKDGRIREIRTNPVKKRAMEINW
jgi:putative ABC transport system ATP-binding protein